MWSHHLEPKCLRFKYISQQVSQLNVSHPLRQAGKLWGPQDGLAVSYMHEKQDIHPRTIWGSLIKRGLILGRDVSSITSIAYLKLCTIMGHFSCICESQQQRKPDLQGRDRLAKVGKSGSLERGKSYNHRVSGEQYVQGSVDKSCPTLRPHGLYSPSGSSVQGISQPRILLWIAISFSGDLLHPGMETLVS